MLKYRSSSSSSLPRNATDIEQTFSGERKFATSSRSSESVVNLSESEMDHKKTLQELNSRLVAYVEKVRKLQRTTDAIDSMPKQGFDEQSISVIKKKFEAELSDWKSKQDESQAEIAQLKIDLSNSSQEKKQLQVKINDKLSVLRERDAHISNLEAEINGIVSKLNLLQNEKGKLMDNEAVYKSDITDLQKELDFIKKSFDKEKMKNAELEGKVSSMEKDKGFQIQLLQAELEEERKRNKVDLSALDRELKSDYEARLRAEMLGLRKVYEEQTEKAKHEFMHLHSAKLSELQEALSEERSTGLAGRSQLKDVKARTEQLKSILTSLEADKLQLGQQVADLTGKLEEQGATFRSQIKSKDTEVGLLHREIERLRSDYEKLVEIKQALTLEISIYKQIIEGEEKRIRKVSKKISTDLRRMSSSTKAEDLTDSSSNSESDKDVNRGGFKEVDEIDGKKLRSKTSVNYYSRSSRSNY